MEARPVTPALEIRSASNADLPAMCALCGELGYAVSNAEFARRMRALATQQDQHAVFVAATEDAVIGWVHVRAMLQLQVPAHAEVVALIVNGNSRGQQIGKKLMHAAEQWAQQHSLGEVRLYSSMVRSKDAHWFYQRLDYQDVKPTMLFKKSVVGGV